MATKKKKPPPGPKSRKGRRIQQAPRITTKTYEVMWAAWLEKQTIEYVRKKANVSWPTAEKYVERGDPGRGLEGLRDRYARIQRKAQKQEDYTIVRARQDTLNLIRAYKVRLSQRIKNIDLDEMSNSIGVELDRIARLEEEFMQKGTSLNVSVDSLFAGWTDDELDEYARTGRWPDRPLDSGAGSVSMPIEPDVGGGE